MSIMAHNGLCIYIIHYVQFIILGKTPGLWTLWTDYEHYELPKPLMSALFTLLTWILSWILMPSGGRPWTGTDGSSSIHQGPSADNLPWVDPVTGRHLRQELCHRSQVSNTSRAWRVLIHKITVVNVIHFAITIGIILVVLAGRGTHNRNLSCKCISKQNNQYSIRYRSLDFDVKVS